MGESLLPTALTPGMIALREKSSGKVTQHFPVDAREILSSQPGKYEMEKNGSVEAARMNAGPLQLAQDTTAAQIVGIEGQVMVAMTPEDAEKWKKLMASTAGVEVPAEKPAEDKKAEAPKAAEKPAEKAADKPAAK